MAELDTIFTDARTGFNAQALQERIEKLSEFVQTKIDTIRSAGSTVAIADMFDMQVLMNKLSQFSEMSTGIIAASNTAIQSMARNVKG